jgi:hypothetical protein
MLTDKTEKLYPNPTHTSSIIEQSNYLVLKAGDKFTAIIGATGCNKDTNDQCKETVSIGLFGPDWSLIKEIHDAKFYIAKEDIGIINQIFWVQD